jgi:galactokinase
MTQANDRSAFVHRFLDHVRKAMQLYPRGSSSVAMSRCPGVLDVMGGIGEDSGSLVLTATLAMSFLSGVWPVADDNLHLRMLTEAGQGPARDFTLPLAALEPGEAAAAALIERCRQSDCGWAAPTCLAIQQAVAEAVVPRPDSGLMILIQSDFPADAEFGRPYVQAAACLDAIRKLSDSGVDRLRQSRACSTAVARLTGMSGVRTVMTALCAPPGLSLLQLRFLPQVLCQPLELPTGLIAIGAGTRLARPTSRDRLVETRACSEMGRAIIVDLQRRDGVQVDESSHRLSAITPTEYVERFRDRLPSKITGKAFIAKFGELRGLNAQVNPDEVYKVRSRAEHHIYENRRVHEFAASIVRARRNNSLEALTNAGDLMYASHWSHSQRCGIGGVEPDQFVSCIRKHGPAVGLFGAKVTGAGAGGEMVVLMRDTPQTRAALAAAVASAEAINKRKIHVWDGSLPGAEHFQPPKVEEAVEAVATT